MFPWQIDTIHPLIIHFPIALLSASVLFDILGVVFRKESLNHAGWWCLVCGVMGALAAVLTGFFADTIYGHMGDPFPVFETHGTMQIAATLIFVGLFIWRGVNKCQLPSEPLKYVYLAIGAAATGWIFYGAHLGAQLAGRI